MKRPRKPQDHELFDWIPDTRPTHRLRRGRLVEIPERWRGVVTHPQTIRKRQSKQIRKQRMRRDVGGRGHPRTWAPRHGGPKFMEE